MLAGPGGPRVSTDDLAAALDIPHAYLEKVINHLSHCGLLFARRGPGGGLVLKRPPDEISLYEIVHAFDDSMDHPGCLLGMDEKSAQKFCPCQEFFHDVTSLVEHRIKELTLADVIKRHEHFCDSASCDIRNLKAESVAIPISTSRTTVRKRVPSLKKGRARER